MAHEIVENFNMNTTNKAHLGSSSVPTRQSLSDNGTMSKHDIDSDTPKTGSITPDNPSRKRKRTRNDKSRKFECRECGKEYSRAEHLYRHQLNHAPKQIFECEWPNCPRTFVRQDLRARHMERHIARNAEIPHKDFMDRESPPTRGIERAATHDGISGNKPSQTAAGEFIDGLEQPGNMTALTSPSRFRTRDMRPSTSVPPALMPFQSLLPQRSSDSLTFQPTSIPSPAYSSGTERSHPKTNTSQGSAPLDLQRQIQQNTESRGKANEYNTSHYDIDGQGHPNSGQFGTSTPNYSAYQYPDELTAWLFESSNQAGQPFDVNNFGMFSEHVPYYLQDLDLAQDFNPPLPHPNPMSFSNIIDFNLPESSKISNEKRHNLLELIIDKFSDADQIPERRRAKSFLEGNHDASTHVLSLNMMQTYIASYWYHFHPQVPILHKPTFSADQCPDLLLLAMMALGASCLEGIHGHTITQLCAELASFIAWHLRWALFRHEASRPPAKLWMFQALLLLEFYEKMYSTRELHERAHIHHATTVTLLRRGSFLVGNAAAGPDHTNTNLGYATLRASDPWWDHWIQKEATRRAVFAAFVMDILHAVSFTHSAEMATHEMRLPLPCDEALWSATSGAEVSRIEASLQANGVKPPNFLDALKRTLNRQRVQTNPFGRTIIMSGLLSVSWHLNQRDLQVTALGVGGQKPAGKVKWRISMGKAFAFWKEDFDLSLAQAPAVGASSSAPGSTSSQHRSTQGVDDENVFESRIVMLHLAHMSMHVDIVDCEIYAGAKLLVGRPIMEHDYVAAKRRIKDVWAPSDRAREAAFHALKFISQVLMPEAEEGQLTGFQHSPASEYSAREDFLINRPWALFIAGLIIWCYGYALDGPVSFSSGVPPPETTEEKVADTKVFLQRVGGVESPEDLTQVKRRSSCVGLLMTLKDLFVETRWELLHEAANIYGLCIEKLLATGSPER